MLLKPNWRCRNSSEPKLTTIEKVKAALVDECGVQPIDIKPETRFVDLLDSLEIASFMLELEARLGIEIPEDEAEKLHTVGDVVRYAEKA